jgi:hypothetical protein
VARIAKPRRKKASLESRGTLKRSGLKSDFGKNPEPSNHDHADEKRQVQRNQIDDVPDTLLVSFDVFARNVILEDG